MKAIRWIPITLFALAASACASGVDAGDPATNESSPTAETRTVATSPPATIRPLPTSTASPVRTTVPTRQPLVNGSPRATATSVRPQEPTRGPATATAVPATPTTTVYINGATPTVEPTAVVVSAPADAYVPMLSYSYTLPDGWTQAVVDESILLSDSTGTINVTLTERTIDRWRFQAINVLGVTDFPERPKGWDTWFSSALGSIKGGQAFEFQFTGTKDDVSYLNFVHWYLWGDVNVEVDAEISSFDWNSSSTARSQLQTVLDSFKPHVGGQIMELEEIMLLLEARLDNRPAGVYVRDEVIRGRVEITCRQVFEDLLSEPEYVGNGTWQATAYTLEGAETWWIYEPTGSIVSVDSNKSRC